ncbi:MAG: pilus assembly protein PilY, partial [Planctomycetaceae bacterium]
MEDIAEYLSVIDADEGRSVITHTIGFREDVPQLQRTAEVSGGQYFQADDEQALIEALSRILGDANERGNSFAAPLVAVNSFNRTQHLNELYMTVFQASTKTHWPGNVKKYALSNGEIVDANGEPAVDPNTGFFSTRSRSVWTVGDADGAEIRLGGAANLLPDPALRRLFTNNGFDDNLTGASNALTPGNSGAFTHQDFGMTGSVEEPSVEQMIRWTRGEDIRDEDQNPETTVRFVMGDPLHSRPAAVVYGGESQAADVVIFSATN